MEELLKRLDYNSETGEFIWKDGQRAGEIAGHTDAKGYRVIDHKRKAYKVHRLVWFLHHGSVDGAIDHINHDRSDNRLENLRLCDQSTNMSNQLRLSVWQASRSDKYCARFKHKKKAIYLGSFECPFEAGLAIVRAKRELGLLPRMSLI